MKPEHLNFFKLRRHISWMPCLIATSKVPFRSICTVETLSPPCCLSCLVAICLFPVPRSHHNTTLTIGSLTGQSRWQSRQSTFPLVWKIKHFQSPVTLAQYSQSSNRYRQNQLYVCGCLFTDSCQPLHTSPVSHMPSMTENELNAGFPATCRIAVGIRVK